MPHYLQYAAACSNRGSMLNREGQCMPYSTQHRVTLRVREKVTHPSLLASRNPLHLQHLVPNQGVLAALQVLRGKLKAGLMCAGWQAVPAGSKVHGKNAPCRALLVGKHEERRCPVSQQYERPTSSLPWGASCWLNKPCSPTHADPAQAAHLIWGQSAQTTHPSHSPPPSGCYPPGFNTPFSRKGRNQE